MVVWRTVVRAAAITRQFHADVGNLHINSQRRPPEGKGRALR
jgi:hypothetical protein